MSEQHFVVLFRDYNGSVSDYAIIKEPLETAIAWAKANYRNLGHYTAVVVPYEPLYKVSYQEVETTYKSEMKP